MQHNQALDLIISRRSRARLYLLGVGLLLLGLLSTEVISANSTPQHQAGTDLPAPIGYWRMEQLNGDSVFNTAAGQLDGQVNGGLSQIRDATDNNVSIIDGTGHNTNVLAWTATTPNSGQFIQVDQSETYNRFSALTLSAWIKMNNIDQPQAIIGNFNPENGVGYRLYLESSEVIALISDGTEISIAAAPLPSQDWTHLTMTWAVGDSVKLYFNGELISTNANRDLSGFDTDCDQNASPAQIGGCHIVFGGLPDNPASSNLIDAALDEVILFDTALTETEVAQLSQRVFYVNLEGDDPNLPETSACIGTVCTFRGALIAANNTPNSGTPDHIYFLRSNKNVPILTQVFLPPIVDPVLIDGSTQPGASCDGENVIQPGFALDGSGLSGANQFGLSVQVDDVTIRGLRIGQFSGPGIISDGANRLIVECSEILSQEEAGILILGGISHRIGGLEPSQRNIIAGNQQEGVRVVASANGLILGNTIGTTSDGQLANGNLSGILLESSSNYLVTGNQVSGNQQAGIEIQTGADIEVNGNIIGTDPRGLSPIPNGSSGIQIDGSAAVIMQGNTIGFNDGSGISVIGESFSNFAFDNSFLSNVGLGIDLGNDGRTPNDPIDTDSGPNGLQNFPVLTEAVSTGTTVIITGTLSTGIDDSQFGTISFNFYTNDEGESCQGEILLPTKSLSLTREGEGLVSFRFESDTAVTTGKTISGIASTFEGSSEISDCLPLSYTGPTTPQPPIGDSCNDSQCIYLPIIRR